MNSSKKLDSAVFQLTPTRTRFDLVIIVNGKKEKIASGLLHPFLSHLKVAQDQIAKGGYSVVLEPNYGNGATWFTKGTVERFVRFVSTPDILERVYTLESEILQIEEAISIQANNSIGISTIEENQIKQVESAEGRKIHNHKDTDEQEAIVLYKEPEANGSTKLEGNSKVELLKVLEMRKSVLQKEQEMAFARAVAAGFEIERIPDLMAFAECFEASRLMDACRRFMELWKRKHESGQWLEIEAAEVMPNQIDLSAINASVITLSNMAATSHIELESGNNGKTNSVDQQAAAGLQVQDNFQGQFPHHGFPPWPVHSPTGALPPFQPYTMQGIPYCQSYPGNNSFMQPVFSLMEHPRLNAGQNMGNRRHSMNSGNYNTESEALEREEVMEREGSQSAQRWKKGSRSGRRKSGMVVIRNINYVTKTDHMSASGSCSDSVSETDDDTQESMKTSKRRGTGKESLKKLNSSNKDEADHGKDAEGGHWEAFQNCLLRGVDEARHSIYTGQFELEKVDHVRRKTQDESNDPLDFSKRDVHEVHPGCAIDMLSISRGSTHMPKASNDHLLLSRRAGQSGNIRSADDIQSLNTAGRMNCYRRVANDDFIIHKQDNEYGNANPSTDMEVFSGQGYSNNELGRRLFHDVNDDSHIVEHRSVRVNGAGNIDRNAIDMNSKFPKLQKKVEKFSYQPNDLSLMPERGAEKGLIGYDPALDYEMQAQGNGASQDKNRVRSAQTKLASKILNKEQRSKLTPNSSDKKTNVGPIRRGKTNKLSPLDDARARAERVRNYKADLQKMRKEKEEEEKKRIEALKLERQKRIAARSSSVTTKTPVPSKATNKQLPPKLSPNSHKGSKFSDSEPRSSSPFQRFAMRTGFVGSNGPSKALKTSRLNTGSHSATNKLSRSVPSLYKSKLEMDDGITKASMARIRRLSEPKMTTTCRTSFVEACSSSTRKISKIKAADETEIRKISTIVNHDKSRTATLPELKIKTSKASDNVQKRSSSKEKTQKLNDNKSSMNSACTLLKKNGTRTALNNDGDDNPIIDKTVVMLECAKASHKSGENPGIPKRQHDNNEVMDKTETSSSYVAVHAPMSPLSKDIVDIGTLKNQSLLQPISSEVKINNREKEHSKSSSISAAKEAYHAPYAHLSTLEDRCTRNSEYGKAPPTSLETSSTGVETFRARISETRNSTLEKIPEIIEKPQAKESSKGLRGLLKFGRKNHGSPSSGFGIKPDNGSADGSEPNNVATNGSVNEVHTLKNLILQDESTSTCATPQKSSRAFSLLSPFRSKNSQKKIMMA